MIMYYEIHLKVLFSHCFPYRRHEFIGIDVFTLVFIDVKIEFHVGAGPKTLICGARKLEMG